jgi:hypothetical protein
MPEYAANVQNNIKDRISSLKKFASTEVDYGRKFIADLRGRFGVEAREPVLCREANMPGKVCGLPDLPVALTLLTLDNISTLTREQAEITRRWFRR